MSNCRCQYMRMIEIDLKEVRAAIDAIDQVIHATPNSTKAIWITDKHSDEYFQIEDYLKDIKLFLESLDPERDTRIV